MLTRGSVDWAETCAAATQTRQIARTTFFMATTEGANAVPEGSARRGSQPVQDQAQVRGRGGHEQEVLAVLTEAVIGDGDVGSERVTAVEEQLRRAQRHRRARRDVHRQELKSVSEEDPLSVRAPERAETAARRHGKAIVSVQRPQVH